MGTSKIEIGAGFMITALSGFDLLHSYLANTTLIIIGVALIGHGVYDVWIGNTWRLRPRVIKWLNARHWVLREQPSPSFYFVLLATEPEARFTIQISRGKTDAKGILAFTTRVPLGNGWAAHFSFMTENERQVLTNDLLVLVETMGFGHEDFAWPYDKLAIQDALPIDTSLSEHTVDLKAKAMVRGAIALRSTLRKAIVQSSHYIEQGQKLAV